MSRSRDYAFTFYPEEGRELFTSNKVIRYIIYGIEKCPKTGRTHFQGYAYFVREVSWKVAQKALTNYSMHLEECKGDREVNIHYCMKGEQSKEEWDKFREKGPNWGINAEIKEFGDRPKQGVRSDIHRVKKDIEYNKPLKTILKENTSYQACKMAELKYRYLEVKRPITNVEVIWIWGGTARQRKFEAYSIDDEAFTPINDKWWDGYDGDKTVLVEEYDQNYCSSKRLDQLTDMFPFRVETKGGSRQVQYTKIIFTSKDYPDVPEEIIERLSLRNICAEVEGNTSLDYDSASEEIERYLNRHSSPNHIDLDLHSCGSDDYDDGYIPFTGVTRPEGGVCHGSFKQEVEHQSKIGSTAVDVSGSLRREDTVLTDNL